MGIVGARRSTVPAPTVILIMVRVRRPGMLGLNEHFEYPRGSCQVEVHGCQGDSAEAWMMRWTALNLFVSVDTQYIHMYICVTLYLYVAYSCSNIETVLATCSIFPHMSSIPRINRSRINFNEMNIGIG